MILTYITVAVLILTVLCLIGVAWTGYLNKQYPSRPSFWRRPK